MYTINYSITEVLLSIPPYITLGYVGSVTKH